METYGVVSSTRPFKIAKVVPNGDERTYAVIGTCPHCEQEHIYVCAPRHDQYQFSCQSSGAGWQELQVTFRFRHAPVASDEEKLAREIAQAREQRRYPSFSYWAEAMRQEADA